jgi:hypothetical protein
VVASLGQLDEPLPWTLGVVRPFKKSKIGVVLEPWGWLGHPRPVWEAELLPWLLGVAEPTPRSNKWLESFGGGFGHSHFAFWGWFNGHWGSSATLKLAMGIAQLKWGVSGHSHFAQMSNSSHPFIYIMFLFYF